MLNVLYISKIDKMWETFGEKCVVLRLFRYTFTSYQLIKMSQMSIFKEKNEMFIKCPDCTHILGTKVTGSCTIKLWCKKCHKEVKVILMNSN